jgi:hypothetical protein
MSKHRRSAMGLLLSAAAVVALAPPAMAAAAPREGTTGARSSSYAYTPAPPAQGAVTGQSTNRPAHPSLSDMKAEERRATASYRSDYGAPQVTATQTWTPPKFAYDYINTVDECAGNEAANGTEGSDLR